MTILVVLNCREINKVKVDCLVGYSCQAFDKLYVDHVHMLALMNLIDLSLHRLTEQWSYFTRPKVIIADTRASNEFDKAREADCFWVTGLL